MPMNLVIQEKRKELGLTQEQVAGYLNVSIPAVSKWEKGTTSPDISLLSPLARLLKIDLNTLFCFHEDITQQEIDLFCKEVGKLVGDKGLEEGFTAAGQKIHEYPHNEKLMHVLTLQLDGLLSMSDVAADEMRPYEEQILEWYHRLAGSIDIKISNSANFMLASRYLRSGEYEKAQETLDLMPDRNDIACSMADKFWLQVEIDKLQGNSEKATEDLQRELHLALNKVQLLLYKMMNIELEYGELLTAKKIAEKSAQMVALFEMLKFSAFTAPLEIAFAEKDAEKCISILREMLAAMREPWNMDKTLLFNRIPEQATQPEQMIPVILSAMEKEPLLQNHSEFQELITEYERFKDRK
ncbi:helix-turn-helix transcriptional regulator [Lachnospiraceae bacterium 29-84]